MAMAGFHQRGPKMDGKMDEETPYKMGDLGVPQ